MGHIAIIGFNGSGKTRVGKRLAKDLGLPFIDLDKAVSKKMNMSVGDIFQKFGEPYYRALETLILKEVAADNEKKVVSLGAGLPLQEQNQKILGKLGTVLYIRGSAETLIQRLRDTDSPLIEDEGSEAKIQKMVKQRDPVYAKFADIIVETGIMPLMTL